jgi:hypothetical protein
MKERHEIQKYFYNFVALHKIQIMFFNWFKSFYVFEYHITYSFLKHACLLTCRNKTHVSKLTSGTFIEFEHLPFRNLKILYNS